MEEIRLAGVQIPVHHGRVDLSGTALAAHAWFQEFMSWFQEAVDDERLLPDHERLFSACVGGPSVEVLQIHEMAMTPNPRYSKATPTIGELLVALLRHGFPNSLKFAGELLNIASSAMAHNWTVWGHQMVLQDYSSQHQYKHTQDRGVWDQVVQMVWHKVKNMNEALQEAKLSRSAAIPIFKAP